MRTIMILRTTTLPLVYTTVMKASALVVAVTVIAAAAECRSDVVKLQIGLTPYRIRTSTALILIKKWGNYVVCTNCVALLSGLFVPPGRFLMILSTLLFRTSPMSGENMKSNCDIFSILYLWCHNESPLVWYWLLHFISSDPFACCDKFLYKAAEGTIRSF